MERFGFDMCFSNCPYEFRSGDCKLNGEFYPDDAHCIDKEERKEKIQETLLGLVVCFLFGGLGFAVHFICNLLGLVYAR